MPSAHGRVPADRARRDPDLCDPRDSQTDIDAHSCALDAPSAAVLPSHMAAVVARHDEGPAFYANLDRGDLEPRSNARMVTATEAAAAPQLQVQETQISVLSLWARLA